jgi:ADP-heptose:LPS heptosyltransferase
MSESSKKASLVLKSFLYSLMGLLFMNRKLKRSLDPMKVKKVLITRYDAIGDMAATMPMFRFIKSLNPQTEIHVLGSSLNRRLIEYDPYVTKIINYDGSLLKSIPFLLSLRKERYDVIITGYYVMATKTGIIANLIGGPRAIKANVWQGDYRYALYNFQSKRAAEIPNMWGKMFAIAYDLFENDIEDTDPQPYLNIPDDIMHEVADLLQEIGAIPRRFILINVSARDNNMWDIDRFASLIELIARKYPELMIIINATAKHQDYANELINKASATQTVKNILLWRLSPDILEIAALCSYSLMLITPDTGMIHIAAALNIPVLAFYPSEYNSTFWAPFGVACRCVPPPEHNNVNSISLEIMFKKFIELYKEVKR